MPVPAAGRAGVPWHGWGAYGRAGRGANGTGWGACGRAGRAAHGRVGDGGYAEPVAGVDRSRVHISSTSSIPFSEPFSDDSSSNPAAR